MVGYAPLKKEIKEKIQMSDFWLQIIFIFIANAVLIIFFRTQSRSDWGRMDEILNGIREDMKAFHDRLINIYEKQKEDK
jgi:hypothetical protein